MIEIGRTITFNWCESMSITVPDRYDSQQGEVVTAHDTSSFVRFSDGWAWWIENIYLTPVTK
jgi:hypothetical protein